MENKQIKKTLLAITQTLSDNDEFLKALGVFLNNQTHKYIKTSLEEFITETPEVKLLSNNDIIWMNENNMEKYADAAGVAVKIYGHLTSMFNIMQNKIDNERQNRENKVAKVKKIKIVKHKTQE